MIPKQVVRSTRDFFFCVPHFMAVVHLFLGRQTSIPCQCTPEGWSTVCSMRPHKAMAASVSLRADLLSAECGHTRLWLPVLGIFNANTGVDACNCLLGLQEHCKRVCTESWLGERSLAVWETWTRISGAPNPMYSPLSYILKIPCHRTVIWVKGFSECYISHTPSTTPQHPPQPDIGQLTVTNNATSHLSDAVFLLILWTRNASYSQ